MTRTEHGNDTYGSSAGQHDDLLLALSLALWLTENRRIHDHNQNTTYVPLGDIPGIVAMGEGVPF